MNLNKKGEVKMNMDLVIAGLRGIRLFLQRADHFYAIDETLSLLKSLKEMEGVVPKKKDIILREASYLKEGEEWNACRSQTLLGLAGFELRLPEIIAKYTDMRFHNPLAHLTERQIKELSQTILNELKGE